MWPLGLLLRFNVTKWLDNVKLIVDLKSTHQGLSYEVLHNIVLSILKYDLGVHHFWPGANHEGQGLSALKTNQLSDRPYATFTPRLKLF
jgi:hypothetical protein